MQKRDLRNTNNNNNYGQQFQPPVATRPAAHSGYRFGGMGGMGGEQVNEHFMSSKNMNLNEMESIVHSFTSETDRDKHKRTVCVHWLKKVCRKGEKCEYLHFYDEEKIPICKFQKENGECHQKDQCVYRHPEQSEMGASKKQEKCPLYERGFCKLSSYSCPFGHVQERVCENYMLGFCPNGPNCKFVHVKSFVAPQDLSLKAMANFPVEWNWMDQQLHELVRRQHLGYRNNHNGMIDRGIICYRCGHYGHKSTYCQEEQISPAELEKIRALNPQNNQMNQRVVCFSCGRKGHYADACPEKAARAAMSATSPDKPIMSREERFYSQVDKLRKTGNSNNQSANPNNNYHQSSSHQDEPMNGGEARGFNQMEDHDSLVTNFNSSGAPPNDGNNYPGSGPAQQHDYSKAQQQQAPVVNQFGGGSENRSEHQQWPMRHNSDGPFQMNGGGEPAYGKETRGGTQAPQHYQPIEPRETGAPSQLNNDLTACPEKEIVRTDIHSVQSNSNHPQQQLLADFPSATSPTPLVQDSTTMPDTATAEDEIIMVTGVDISSLPFSPDQVKSAIQELANQIRLEENPEEHALMGAPPGSSLPPSWPINN